MNKIELLAPAGDLQRVKTAIRYGADAVYCGGKQLSLRNRAGNLTIEELKEAVEYGKKYNAVIYVTVNMVPHHEDLGQIEEYLKDLESIGVKGIIVSSFSIMKLAKRIAPKLEVHISTQQSITNEETVRFWMNQGADRIVLARELNLEEIRSIYAKTGANLEVFIHGGMCSNYSGRCLISNLLTNRDANRGGCAQSCRWIYHTEDDKPITFGSKDMNTLPILHEILSSGACSLKIEGRMKTAFYLASVVSAYRYVIDQFEKNGVLTNEDYDYAIRYMGNVQNRESYTGFYHDESMEHCLILPNDKDYVTQDYFGDVLEYDENQNQALIQVRNHMELGDSIEILHPGESPKSFSISKMTDEEGNLVEIANKPMQKLWIPVPYAVEKGDFLRRAYERSI